MRQNKIGEGEVDQIQTDIPRKELKKTWVTFNNVVFGPDLQIWGRDFIKSLDPVKVLSWSLVMGLLYF